MKNKVKIMDPNWRVITISKRTADLFNLKEGERVLDEWKLNRIINSEIDINVLINQFEKPKGKDRLKGLRIILIAIIIIETIRIILLIIKLLTL